MSVSDGCSGVHAVKVVVTIAELADLCPGIEVRLGRQRVGALAIEGHPAGKGSCLIGWQEVAQLEVSGLQVGLVGEASSCIDVCLSAHRTVRLCGGEVGSISWPVGTEVAFHANARRNAHAIEGLGRHKGGKEVYLICLSIDVEIGFQMVHVGHVGHRSAGIQVESPRQTGVQPCQFHVLHVSAHYGLHRQRCVGPLADESLRHTTQKTHDVLLAEHAIGTQVHLAGQTVAESILIHHQMGVKCALGSSQTKVGQIYLLTVESQPSAQTVHAESALLSQRGVAHTHVELGRGIGQRVYADIDLAQCQMTVVETADGLCRVVVIAERAVVPVELAHAIVAPAKVEATAARHGVAQIGGHLQRVAGQVYSYMAALHLQIVHQDLPLVVALGGVGRHAVGQHHTDVGVAQQGVVHA